MEKEIKRITKALEEIAEAMCNSYCKYPEMYRADVADPEFLENRYQALLDERCANCPLMRI